MEALCQLLTQSRHEVSPAAGRKQRSHWLAVEEGCQGTGALIPKLHGCLPHSPPVLSPLRRASVVQCLLVPHLPCERFIRVFWNRCFGAF